MLHRHICCFPAAAAAAATSRSSPSLLLGVSTTAAVSPLLLLLRGAFPRLHSSLASQGLGVVEHLHDEIASTLPAGSSKRSFWEVVEFRPDATALETWKTPEVLGLHPRDVSIFTSDSGFAHRALLAPRSGALLYRTEIAKAVIYSDKAVLFPAKRVGDTIRVAQSIKSALHQRSALPFELKVLEALLSDTAQAFDKKTKRFNMVAETIMDDINNNFSASAAELSRIIPIARKLTELQHDLKETLDAIADVVNYDDQLQSLCLTERAKALKAVGSKALGGASVSGKFGSSGGKHGTSTQKEVHLNGGDSSSREMGTSSYETSYFYDGSSERDREKDYFEPIIPASGPIDPGGSNGSVGGSGANNGGSGNGRGDPQPQSGHGFSSPLPLRLPPVTTTIAARSAHMRMASRILETYEFRLMGTHSALNEMQENIEQTRTVWHMQLDHQRNRVLRVNLLISICSLGGLMCTLPAAFFGMNLDSGLEDVPDIFWPVLQGSVTAGFSFAALIYFYYKYGPKRMYKARVRDMRSLRDLLSYHMDDVDGIIDAIRARGSVSRREFEDVVAAAVKGKPMSKEEIALLFRVFDTNKDAVLELSELMKLEELQDKLQDDFDHHMT